MNLQIVANIVLTCSFLLCVFFLVRSLIHVVRKGIHALRSGSCAELEQLVKPIPYTAFFWLVLIWVVVGINVLARSSYSFLDAPMEAIALCMLSIGVIIVTLLASQLITNLNRHGIYDLNLWRLLVLRIAIAIMVVGVGVLCVTFYSGTSVLATPVLHWDASVFPALLKLLGLMVAICIATLGLISNGWIKTILGLDSSTFHVRVSPVTNKQSSEPNRGDEVDLETEFFFHIRNLKHENDT